MKRLPGLFLLCTMLSAFSGEDPVPVPEKEEAPAETPEQGEDPQTEARIRELISWLLDGDPELAAVGRQELMRFGLRAVPYIEEAARGKGAGELLLVLRKILASEGDDSEWIDEVILARVEAQLKRERKDLTPLEREAYVRSRLREAVLLAREGKYQNAHDIVNGLLVLEPGSRFRSDMKRFRRWCDQRILQTAVVKARIAGIGDVAVVGDELRFRLRLENVSSHTIVLRYLLPEDEKPEGTVPAAKIIVPLTVVLYDSRGNSTEHKLHREIPLETEVEIAMGAQWEKEVVIATRDMHPPSESYREYRVDAWTYPREIDLGVGSLAKKIVFEPRVIRAVPPKYAVILEDPLLWLGKTMDSGTVDEVFCAAMLLDESQRSQGVEMLVGALEANETDLGAKLIANMLHHVTGRGFGVDPRRWRTWLESESGEKEEEEDK